VALMAKMCPLPVASATFIMPFMSEHEHVPFTSGRGQASINSRTTSSQSLVWTLFWSGKASDHRPWRLVMG